MKFFARSIFLTLAFSCFAADGADEVKESPSIVRLSIEWIEMSSSDATALLRTPRTTTNDADLRDKVDEMIDAEKAHIYESKVVTTHLGAPSRVESIREEIYPTSYDPPELPSEVNIYADGTTTPSAGSLRTTGPSATAFETRNTGVTVEIDPVYNANEKTFRLNMSAEIVNLVDQNKFASYEDDRMTSDIAAPIFYTNRMKTTLIVKPGEYLLATTMTPFGEDGQPDRTKRLVVFVRAELLKVGY